MRSCFFCLLELRLFHTAPNAGQTDKTQTQEQKETIRVRRIPGTARGDNCDLIPTDIISLIVPENQIAKTVSDKPTVFLYVSQDIVHPLEVIFYSRQSGTIFTSRLEKLPQGFVAVKIPEDSPGLKIGEVAKFTATVVCHEKQRSRNLWVQGWIERTSIPQINQDSSILDCNVDYAEAGIWYDALYCAYSQLNNKENVSVFGEDDFNSLLEQINFAELKIENSETQNLTVFP